MLVTSHPPPAKDLHGIQRAQLRMKTLNMAQRKEWAGASPERAIHLAVINHTYLLNIYYTPLGLAFLGIENKSL